MFKRILIALIMFISISNSAIADNTNPKASLQKAAEAGDANAQLKLATLLFDENNSEQALNWLKIVAKNEDKNYSQVANYGIGEAYAKGLGVEKNFDTAIEWYKKAAKNGYIPAQFELGLAFNEKKKNDEALSWFKAIDDNKYFRDVEKFCARNRGQTSNLNCLDASEAEINNRAEGYRTTAQFNIGYIYYTAKDFKQAFKWYEKAAIRGSAIAIYSISIMYQNGEGVEQDDQKSKTYRIRAAELGDINAQNLLKEDFDIYSKRANQGDAVGQYDTALFYLFGWSVPKDKQKAIELLKKSAAQGFEPAKSLLAKL